MKKVLTALALILTGCCETGGGGGGYTVTIWGRAIPGEACPKREVSAAFGEGYASGISETLQKEYWATHH